jgi:hypothetical protein
MALLGADSKGVVTSMTTGWQNFVTMIGGIPGRVSGFLKDMWKPLWDGFRAIVNKVVGGWNRLSFSVPSVNIPGIGQVGGQSIRVTQLPTLQAGAIAMAPTLAMIGEGSEPEAVVPLSRLKSMIGGGGGGTTIVVPITNAVVGNNEEIMRVVTSAIREAVSRGLMPNSLISV